jgi:RHS repeat-associated protein
MEVTQLVTALIEMIFMQRSFKESVHLLCKKAHSLVFILAFLFSIDSFGQAPAAPDKLGAVVVSSSSVILNWEDKSNNETGFQIERSLSFGIGYSLLNTTAANVRTFTDTGLTAGTTYYYRVRSVNSSGNSFYTLEVIAPVARADYRRFLLDFGDPVKQTTATGWTNITSVVAGSIIPLKDSNGNTTSLNLEVVTEPSANYFGGNDWISTGYNGQMADYPISAVNDSHLAWSGGGSYKLTGLDNSKVYDLRIFGSRSASGTDREGLYTVNGQQKILQAANNSSRTVLFDNIAPINGIITINFNVAPGSTFAYINVMDIIESTNPSPPGVISKLVLMPSMASIVSPVGEGNPALLLDEQELAGNPAGAAGGQPTTSWGTNLGPKVMTAQIDLGAEYVIKQVWFFDSNGEATLPDGYKVLAVTPAGEATLVNSPMTGYLQWTSFDVDVTARILKVVNPTGYVGMNELVLYGYAVGTNAVPTANAGADQTVDLPNSLSITGSGTDSDGTIASYLWTQVSGPNTATLTGSNTATVTPTFLVAGTYVFRLTVTDNLSATGSDDVEVIVNNPGQGPAAPDKLGAVVVSSSSVILNWEDKSNNETGFQIERSLSFGIGYSLLNTTAANVRTFTDTGLTAGTTYYYRVRSVNSSGNSFYTLEVIAPVARADYRRFLLDFGDPVKQTTATGWTNITSVVAGSIIPLKDSNGNTTSLNLEVVTEPSANYFGGNDWISTGYNGQMADYPISAVNDSHLAWSGGGSYKLTGLDNSKVYDLRIFGSRSASGTDREGLYTVNGQQKILQAANNSSRTVLFDNIAPINGIITINFNVAPGSAFGYINVMDIIESTNPSPPGVISKLVLMPSMASIVSPVGEGNPALLLDEQELAGNPAGAAGGQPTTSWGTNQGTKVMTAQIDLGAEYVIKQVWFFDSNGEATLPDGYKVLAVTPAGEATLVNSTMEGYLTWTSFDVDVTARILKVVNPTGYLGMNELVLYGYLRTATPIADAGEDKLVTLASISTSLTGSGTDSDGTIVSYAWTQVSGPNTAVLSGGTMASATISSLAVGTYIFRLTVTDNEGATGHDEVTITVSDDGLVPDALELEALRIIAEGADSDRLTSMGWPSVYNWPTSSTAADFGSWQGVTVVDQDIRDLYISGDYFGYFPDVDLPQLKALYLSHTLLYGINASLPNLEQLWIDYNFIADGINFAAYPKLKYLSMISYSYDCMGCEPYDPDRTNFDGRNYYPSPDMSALVELETYEGGSNNFLVFPTGLASLTNIKYIYLQDNFMQSIPNEIANFNQLIDLDVSQNYLTDLPLTLGDLPSLQSLYLSQNRLDFGDLEQFFSGENEFKNPYLDVQYDNQGNLPPQDIIASAGKYILINNRSGGIHTHYQWQEYNAGNWDNIPDKTLQNLVFDNMDPSYVGKRYRCEITNDWITDITIYSSEFTIESVSDFPMLAPTSLAAAAGSSLSISLSWVDNSNDETGFEIERSTVSGGFENVGLAPANAVSYSDPGLTEGTSYYYRIRAINATGSSDYSEEATATPQYNIDELITQDSLRVVTLPPQVKVTREGLRPLVSNIQSYPLDELNQDDDKLVFPGCSDGKYFVGFELKYNFDNKNTELEWLSKLNITLLKSWVGGSVDTVWTSPLQINSKTQNFLTISFYDVAIRCRETNQNLPDYSFHFIIEQKLNVGEVPEESITLSLHMYEDREFDFSTTTKATFACPTPGSDLGFDPNTGESRVAWDYNPDATEFDLEWVFLSDDEIDAIADFHNSASEAFQNKEGVRITTAERNYKHLIYYQTGKLWYRVRAVSYNPTNPDHRITGLWEYSTCSYLEITNPETTRNWQVQTVFAEDGKYKKVVHYFDGTLRTRQSQTNLSSDSTSTTLIGETLYDFEGRKSVEILAAPTEVDPPNEFNYNGTLTFKPGLNTFQSVDPLVASNTSATRIKFNYDNQGAENSKLSEADGAGRYYSTANTKSTVHQMLIPNGEGYVYSQTEYLNDGTGRIKRQSGVGEEFRMDGNHATQYYYGSASKAELVRLFGSNVGTASHYKKNLVVDGNGQMSVSYHDQSDRVIASALAGINPVAVDPLSSLSALQNNPDITIDITDKNERYAGVSITTHKVLNTVPNPYTINYDLTAVNPSQLGCALCSLDFTISVTDPDGELVDLGIIQNNQSQDTHYFSIYNFSGVDCNPSTINVQFPVPFLKIGDYTITKKLVAKELTYEELKTVVVETPAAQQKIQELIIAYNQIDYEKCAVCSTQPELCTDAENTIVEAFNNVAALDCENILQLIKKDLISANSSNPEYVPQQAAIEADGRYCQYLLCIKDKESDVFDKQLAKIASWSKAIEKNFTNPVDNDPYFNNPNLSGSSFKDSMNDKIADYPVTQINGIIFSGSIESITEPTNATFFIDDFGNKTNSNAVGRHILYMDLMERKSQMTPTAYLDELDQQQWALFKSFYLEAKRLTKIEAYAGCASMISELQKVSTIPTTEQGVANWGVPEGITDPVSEYQLDVTMSNIHLACNPSGPFFDPDTTPVLNLSPEHNTDIRNYLRAYFDGHPSNVFRVIIITDLSTDSNLIAIGNILGTYGCGLASLAQEDPIVCLNQRTISFSPQNLVVNTPFDNCTTYDPACSWSPANGTPTIVSQNGDRWATLKALHCSPTTDALRGKLASPLIPGKNYKLSLTYRLSDVDLANKQVSNAYLEFTRNPSYRSSVTYNCNQPPVIAPPSNNEGPTANLAFQGSCNPLNPCCTEPGVSVPDRVDYFSKTRVWESGTLDETQNLNWTTKTILFKASQASTDFVISLVNKQEAYGCQINLWGTRGTYENLSDNTYTNHFNNLTNSYGYPSSGGRTGDNALTIKLNQPIIPCPGGCPCPTDPTCPPNPCPGPDCPCPPGFLCPELEQQQAAVQPQSNLVPLGPANSILAYLDANDEFGGGEYYDISVWVKTPSFNWISSNTQRFLYLDVAAPSITFTNRNFVPLQETNNAWQKLTMRVYTHLPQQILLRSNIEDTEALVGGELLIDDYYVVNFRGSNEESIDIKDVTIVEDITGINFTYCTEYAPPIPHDYLSEFTIKCAENLVNESIVLRELAIDKYLEEEITTYSNTLRANCLDGATENLQYSYTPKEYHYTLYYYDQAGNLVQTVPPEGVVPDPINEPQHKLITRYQYNSLNQLLSQTTPDAGESKFWYNDKSQLKLSQNAQQLIDNKYSYTKYDEQGRITEVGEMAATSEVEELIDDPEFPLEQNLQTPAAGTYVLTDITRTHYDQPFENEVQEGFTQQQLRNRVSWVEVTDQASQTPLVTAAASVFKNEGVLNGVNAQGVLASEVTQSGQTYLRIQNNCSGVCTFAGAEFFSPMPVTAGETYLIKAKGYSQSTAPVGFDIKGNGTQSLASVGIGAALPIGAGAEGWVTQTITVPSGVFMLNINLAWASPALNEVFFINEFEIVKQTIDYTNRAATYYSYDIHGNVKSLLQNVPGLTPKRTDYAYDLVSGKVNYVLYQYDQPDQFIHRYSYDADNRISQVKTSTDGYLWDKDAEYSYYLHGPLARMELGDHRVQGLDYYYTLQGWLKGVNSPTGGNAQINDPGLDGVVASPNDNVGKDVFAYNLGYFHGDYKPIGGTTTQAALIETGTTVSPLWTGVGGEALGLYNGNISWMVTDLAKIGLENSNRNVGVQAMQYRYDQLHRIVQSRSLNYASGAVSRGSAVYDEDYTYDANGNLLTLKRNDELAALKDDFIYTYYNGTNRLKGVADPADSVTYTGAVTSNTKLYKNITLKGNAYIPTGEDVTLRATENIFIENQFNKAGGNSFRAYITEEGQYQYDAIGNLIIDTSEGTKISWTPYGKVRQVKAKGDSVVIDYRYDASGNRIQKRVASLGDAGWGEVFTRYVRDASGNVMAIYSSPLGGGQEGALEQPIYGSSRVGLYKGGRKEGQQWLGRKNFELSNHLGNVLTVITDNVTMSPTEGVSATIVSATDYYPFGLEMQGRTYSDTTYRYGFNGKEKDAAFASTNNYDYGFRIYNPRIAKFLSVDPLTDSYPWYTPYQFSGNNPIRFIDLDGLEEHDPFPEAYLNTKTKVDMTQAPDVFITNSGRRFTTFIKDGRKWNSAWYWEQVRKQAPEMFDLANNAAIDKGVSPIANDTYLLHNKNQAHFKGVTLDHHHLNHGNEAYSLPWTLHRSKGYTKLWHKFGKGLKAVSLVGSFLALAEAAKGDPSAAISGMDPFGVSLVGEDMVQEMENTFTQVALSQSFSQAARYFEGSGDFGVFYAEESDILNLLEGNMPNLGSEKFSRSGFQSTSEAASQRYNSVINFGIIYKRDNNGDYNLVGIKPLDEK